MDLTRLQSLFSLDNKVALITDSGNLASTDVAPMLADAGARVVIADRDTPATHTLAERINAAGAAATVIVTDVESEASVTALFARLRDQFGRVDIVVNCAGMSANQPFDEATMAQFDAVNSLNLRSVFLLMRESVRLMRETGAGGRIVNISTMGSLHPVLKGNQSYSATRAGVTMLSKCTAMDFAADRILCNVVLPGAVVGKTRFHADTVARQQTGGSFEGPGMDKQRLPLGLCPPGDIAAAVLYLVGPSGSYITGQTIVLDGGFLSH